MRRVLQFAILLSAPALVRAEIIDRIAVVVDNDVITDSQVREEIRITAFFNGEKPEFGGASRRKAAERLVDQVLIRREIEVNRYPGPDAAEVETAYQEMKGRFASGAELSRQLEAKGISAGELRQALARQAALLHFIELRFRPEVQVQEEDVRKYYDTTFAPEYQRRRAAAPPYDDVRDDIEETITGQQVDKRVEAWLRDVKTRARIQYEEGAFQ